MANGRKIILEDGRQFCGTAFGAEGDRVCEIVFNTSMVGYQEILSDRQQKGDSDDSKKLE